MIDRPLLRCQAAVSLSTANHSASLPVADRLYLPEGWAKDPSRRAKAGVPADIAFATDTQIALRPIEATLAAGVPRGVVPMHAGHGADTARTPRVRLHRIDASKPHGSSRQKPPPMSVLPRQPHNADQSTRRVTQ